VTSLLTPPAWTWPSDVDRFDRELAICHTAYVPNADLRLDPELIKALANEKRLLILEWLRDPRAHFPAQRDGDLVRDGVCSLFIADKLGVSQPTCGEHLKVLSRAGLIRGTKIKQWVFYQRDEARIDAVKELLSGDW
jgi:DNA-binding transcriptional ArsR family regulator